MGVLVLAVAVHSYVRNSLMICARVFPGAQLERCPMLAVSLLNAPSATAAAGPYLRAVVLTILQGLSHIKETVHLKPASLDSKLHKRLKMTVAKATQKTDKVCRNS